MEKTKPAVLWDEGRRSLSMKGPVGRVTGQSPWWHGVLSWWWPRGRVAASGANVSMTARAELCPLPGTTLPRATSGMNTVLGEKLLNRNV